MKISRALIGAVTICCGVGLLHHVLSAEMMSKSEQQNMCDHWTAQMPPRTEPGIIMQAVSEDYLPAQKNFIVFMEANSGFTRENIYLICLDEKSQTEMANLGLRCVPVFDHNKYDRAFVWKLRVKVLSCLLADGLDIILSDNDALWLKDPGIDFDLPEVRESSIVATRGSFPEGLGRSWGATLCMGLIIFRAGAGMEILLEIMERFVEETGDDQKAINYALDNLKIQWDHSSDMRYVNSTGFGRGSIGGIGEHGLNVTLLPHSNYTRRCDLEPIGNSTVVAHCRTGKSGRAKIEWMKRDHLWKVDELSNNLTMRLRTENEEVVKPSEFSGESAPPSIHVSSGGNDDV